MTLCALGSTNLVNAQDAADMPVVMTIRTNIYGYVGPDNYFTVYLGSTEKDCEFYVEGPKTQEYVYVNPYSVGTDSEGNKTAIATAIPLSVTENNNEVRIYGDASKLDYIDVHGCYLSSIELSEGLNHLSVLDVSYNELTEVDLSHLPSLESIDLLCNSFTDPAKMKIGTNHPNLVILSVGINDVIDEELDLKNFPQLQYFSARNNYGLTSIDPSGCPNLISLVLEVTNISTIDVSKNAILDVLNVSNTKITDIDLSHNTNLGEFYASHDGSFNNQYKIEHIDVSKNTRLQYLDLAGNRLTEIDLTHNPNLVLLYLQRNRLSEIDLSNNTKLSIVDLSNNLFTFATLPLPRPGWDYMYYRSPLDCYFKYKVDEPIDFSKEVIRAPYVDDNGNTITPTTYAMAFGAPRVDAEYALDESLYTYRDGIITFHEAIKDSVYVQFFCDAFPDWPLETAKFAVKTAEDYDAPTTVMSFTPDRTMAGKTVSLRLGATPVSGSLSYPADVYVTLPTGTVTLSGAITGAELPDEPNVTFTILSGLRPVTISLTDGFIATEMAIDGISMIDIDVTPTESFTDLSITNCNLTAIDLSFARDLRHLDLQGNILTSIDFAGARGDYEKYSLTDVNLSNNRLTSMTGVVYDIYKTLNLSNNAFSRFDFKYYTGLVNLDMSNNALEGTLDLTTTRTLKTLNLAGNRLTEVALADSLQLTDINVTNNNMSFATLPIISGDDVTYSYAPQLPYPILSAGSGVNLSSQYLDIDGGVTTFTWKYADTNQTVDNGLITNDKGKILFDATLTGRSLYCEMTNPAFPDFDAQPMTTTTITVREKPTNVVATFTTAQTGQAQIGFRFNKFGANAVYVDWAGDGSSLDEYLYDENNTAIYRACKTYADSKAIVYSYEDPSEVTMMFMMDIALKDLDATPMTKAEAFDIHNAGLTDGSIKLPASQALFELVLDGSNFETQSFPGYPALQTLTLSNNKYTRFDLSPYPNAMFVNISDNSIEEIVMGESSSLYQLDATNNRLTDIDLSGMTNLSELLLATNRLSYIDLSPVREKLRVLNVAGNNFTFATLPRPNEFNSNMYISFYYANQQPMTVSCVGGKVDLSAQADVNGIETEYRWFLGDKQSDVYYDAYYEMFVGEELEGPGVSSDPEYSVTNGVTTFHYPQNRRVICAMTNAEYPNLILYTTPTAVEVTGIEDVAQDGENQLVDVYNMRGICVRRQVKAKEATTGLTPGLYIVGTQKVLVR